MKVQDQVKQAFASYESRMPGIPTRRIGPPRSGSHDDRLTELEIGLDATREALGILARAIDDLRHTPPGFH